jgi:hypothetical protein
MIGIEPETFSPSSSRIAGTVRAPNRTRWTGACSGGGSSMMRHGTCLSSNARRTATHGCEPWTT